MERSLKTHPISLELLSNKVNLITTRILEAISVPHVWLQEFKKVSLKDLELFFANTTL